MLSLFVGPLLYVNWKKRRHLQKHLRQELGERPLSVLERWCWSRRNYIGAFNLNITTTLDAILEESKVREALDNLQKKYIILQSTVDVDKVTGQPYFRVLDNPPKIPLLVSKIDGVDAGDGGRSYFMTLVESEINTPIPAPLLARCRIVYHNDTEKSELLLTVDHTVTDGMGTGGFLKEIVLSCYGMGGDNKKVVPIPPSANNFFPKLPSWMLTIWGLGKLVAYLQFFSKPIINMPESKPDRNSRHIEGDVDQSLRYHSIFVETELNPEDTLNLVEACRRNKATVGTALHTGISIAAAEEILKKNPKCSGLYLSTGTNVDLRRMAPLVLPHLQDMDGLITAFYGAFTFLFLHKIDGYLKARDPKQFWYLASEMKLYCEKSFKSGAHLFISLIVGNALVQKCADLMTSYYINGKVKNYYPKIGFVLSNIGNLGGKAPGLHQDCKVQEKSSNLAARPALFSDEELANIPNISSVHASVTSNSSDTQPLILSFTFQGKLRIFGIFSAVVYTRKSAVDFIDRVADILCEISKS